VQGEIWGAVATLRGDARAPRTRGTRDSRRTSHLAPPIYDQMRNVQSVDVDTNSVSAGSKHTPCTASS
jgi:hypothetical protein